MADELIQEQQVEEIGLRFPPKAWQGFQDFVTKPANFSQFYPDIQPSEISKQQAHELTVRFLNRFWRPNQVGTANGTQSEIVISANFRQLRHGTLINIC